MREIQVGNPEELRILGLAQGDVEAYLHMWAARDRGRGEWFNLRPGQVESLLKRAVEELGVRAMFIAKPNDLAILEWVRARTARGVEGTHTP